MLAATADAPATMLADFNRVRLVRPVSVLILRVSILILEDFTRSHL